MMFAILLVFSGLAQSSIAAPAPARELVDLVPTYSMDDIIKELETKANAKLPDLKTKSSHELLNYIEHMEEVQVHSSIWDECLPKVDLRIALAGRELLRRFEEATGLEEAPMAEGRRVRWNADVTDKWVGLLKSSSPARRCELLEIAYGIEIAKLATASPTRTQWDASPDKMDVCLRIPLGGKAVWNMASDQDKKCREFVWDYDRAKWETRFIHMFPSNLLLPKTCVDPLFPSYPLLKEAENRLMYIWDDNPRWPIGRARAMCGRPLNTHYQDQDGMGADNVRRPYKNVEAEFAMRVHKLPQNVKDFDPAVGQAFEAGLQKIDETLLGK